MKPIDFLRRAASAAVASVLSRNSNTSQRRVQRRHSVEPLESRQYLTTAPVPFQVSSAYSIGAAPSSVVAVDLNNDGKMDAAATAAGDNAISVALGNGRGGFATPVEYSLGSGADPYWIATGDFNGDGKPDIVTANAGNNTISVLLGNGNGTFQPAVSYSLGASPHFILVGDFSDNGKLDIATANFAGTGTLSTAPMLSVFMGNGDGTFNSPWQTTLPGEYFTQASSLAMADFNGDSIPDLAVANNYAGNTVIMLGNGDGTFSYGGAVTTFTAAGSIATGDFNGDGQADLVAVGTLGNTVTQVNVMMGNGDGTFGSPATYYAGRGPGSVEVADLNGDGKPDIVVTNADYNGSLGSDEAGGVSVLLNNGDGSFSPSTAYGTGSGPVSVAVADYNSDGVPDLITADSAGNDLALNLGIGDGTFSAPKELLVNTLLTPYSNGAHPWSISTAGDFNGDGIPDIATDDVDGGVSILTSNGNGTFQPAVRSIAGSNLRGLAVGNFDGHYGVVVGDLYSDTIYVEEDFTSTSFTKNLSYTISAMPLSFAVADVNGDGHPDIIVGLWNSTDVDVLLNNGDGTFAAPRVFAGVGGAAMVTAGDLNGDGKTDLVQTGGTVNEVGTLVNLGNDSSGQWLGFSSPNIYNGGYGSADTNAVIGDFNGDGKPDVAIVLSNQLTLGVFPGNGDGTLGTMQMIAHLATASISIMTADVNNDGLPDLVFANGTANNVAVLLNAGTSGGTWHGFATPFNVASGSNVYGAAAGDFNRDGKTDLATINNTGQNVSVLTQDPPPTNVSAGGPYSVDVGDSITLAASATHPGVGKLYYEWDFDYNGTTFHPTAVGQFATYSAPDSVGSQTIGLRVSDLAGATVIVSGTINVQPASTNLDPVWRFNEGSGTTAASDPTGHSLTLAGGASFTSGISGSALSLNGTSGYASTAGPVLGDATDPTIWNYTVSAWVYWSGTGSATQTILSQNTLAGGTQRVFTLQKGADGHWQFLVNGTSIGNGSPVTAGLESADPAQANTWTQVTGVYLGAEEALQLFVNGENLSTVIPGGPTYYTELYSLVPEGNLIVGAGFNGSAGRNFFSGLIDQVVDDPTEAYRTDTEPKALAIYQNNSLPTGFTDLDLTDQDQGTLEYEPSIANPAGYGFYDPQNDQWTLYGSGAQIGGTADELNFASTPISGNGGISATLSSMPTNTGGPLTGGTAGVMFRDNLADADSATPAYDAPFVDLVYTVGVGLQMNYRAVVGQPAQQVGSTISNIQTPVDLKLLRSGNTFTGIYSRDGITWVTIGQQTVTLDTNAFGGLALTSDQYQVLVPAVFNGISVGPLPFVLSAVPTSSGVVNLSWTSNFASGTTYTIERALASTPTVWTTLPGPTSAWTYSDSVPNNSSTYLYKVIASGTGSPTSNILTVFAGTSLVIQGPNDSANHSLDVEATQATVDTSTTIYPLNDAVIFNPGTSEQTLTVNGGVVQINNDIASQSSTSNLTVDVESGGTVEVATTLHLASLRPAGRFIMEPASNHQLVVSVINCLAGGSLDLADNDLIELNPPTASVPSLSISTLLASGYDGGLWDGQNNASTQHGVIFSSVAMNDPAHIEALGYGEIGQLGSPSAGNFDGQPVSNGAIVIKFTYYGDSNLDGVVDSNDVQLTPDVSLSGNWTGGDFNFDQTVNSSDYSLAQTGVSHFSNEIGGPLLVATLQSELPHFLPTITPDGQAISAWRANWGNGAPSTVFSSTTAIVNPYFNTPGTYLTVLTPLDATGLDIYHYPHLDVTVLNGTTTGLGVPVDAVATLAVTATVATFSAAVGFTAGDFTASVNWGDGSNTAGTVVSTSAGDWSVIATHTYAVSGTFVISTTIAINRENLVDAVSSTATVSAPSFLAEATQAIQPWPGTDPGPQAYATFTDFGQNDVTQYSATVNFGDGSGSESGSITFASGVFSVIADHNYATSGLFLTSVTVVRNGVTMPTVTGRCIVGVNTLGTDDFFIVIDGAPVQTTAGAELDLDATAIDENLILQANGVAYTWSVTEDGNLYQLPATTVTNTAVFAFVPQVAGTYTLTLTGANSAGQTATTTETITVVVPPDPSKLLFSDSFDEDDAPASDLNDANPNDPNWDPSPRLESREAGADSATAPITYRYTEDVVTTNGQAQLTANAPNQLLLASSNSPTYSDIVVSPAHNFIESPGSGSSMVINVDVLALDQFNGLATAMGTAGAASIIFGASAGTNPPTGDTSWQPPTDGVRVELESFKPGYCKIDVSQNGSEVGSGTFAGSITAYHHIRIVISSNGASSNMFDGSSILAANIYVDNFVNPVVTVSATPLSNNYIELEGDGSDFSATGIYSFHCFDNLSISTLAPTASSPEPQGTSVFVAPSLNGTASTQEGTAYTVNASAGGPGAQTIDHWVINWGDGSSTTTLAHTYELPPVASPTQTYSVYAVAYTTAGGVYTSDLLPVTITDVAPTVTLTSMVGELQSPLVNNATTLLPVADTEIDFTPTLGGSITAYETYSYLWTATKDGTTVSLPIDNQANLSFIPGGTGDFGHWVLHLTVSDHHGLSLAFTEHVNVLNANLAGQWLLNDGQGSVAADSFSNAGDATVSGSQQWTPTFLGGGLDFTTPEDTFDAPLEAVTPLIPAGSSYTLTWWIKPVALTPLTDVIQGEAGSSTAFQFQLLNDGGYEAGTGAGPMLAVTAGSIGSLKANEWQQLGYSYDSATGSGTLYYDGVAVAAGTVTPPASAWSALNISNASGTFDDVELYASSTLNASTGNLVSVNYDNGLKEQTLLSDFQTVYNTIKFEPYIASMKGVIATEQTKSANDVDQDSYLFALLQRDGFQPSSLQYVIPANQVIAPAADAIAWLGVVDKGAADALLQESGLDPAGVSQEDAEKLSFYHQWVDVQIATPGGADWIQLDPSWKFESLPVSLTAPQLTYNTTRFLKPVAPADDKNTESPLQTVEDQFSAQPSSQTIISKNFQQLPPLPAFDLSDMNALQPISEITALTRTITLSFILNDNGQIQTNTTPYLLSEVDLDALQLEFRPDSTNIGMVDPTFFESGYLSQTLTLGAANTLHDKELWYLGPIHPLTTTITVTIDQNIPVFYINLYHLAASSWFSTASYSRTGDEDISIVLDADQFSQAAISQTQLWINNTEFAIENNQAPSNGTDQRHDLENLAESLVEMEYFNEAQLQDRTAGSLYNFVGVYTNPGSGVVTSTPVVDPSSIQLSLDNPYTPADSAIDNRSANMPLVAIDSELDADTATQQTLYDLERDNASWLESHAVEQVTGVPAVSTLTFLEAAESAGTDVYYLSSGTAYVQDLTNPSGSFVAQSGSDVALVSLWGRLAYLSDFTAANIYDGSLPPDAFTQLLYFFQTYIQPSYIPGATQQTDQSAEMIVSAAGMTIGNWEGTAYMTRLFVYPQSGSIGGSVTSEYGIAALHGIESLGGQPVSVTPSSPPIEQTHNVYSSNAGDPVDVDNGDLTQDEQDITLPDPGYTISLSRHYDSLVEHDDPTNVRIDNGMGVGWIFSVRSANRRGT